MSASDFKIVLRSTNGTGTNNNSLTYYFDFTPFEDTNYELTFNFASLNNDIDPAIPAELLINWGTLKNYQTVAYSSCASVSNHIGTLFPVLLSTTQGYLRANWIDNPPSVLRRPAGNGNFTVSINNISSNYVSFTGAIPAVSTTLTVSAVASGTLSVGDFIAGAGISIGTYIVAILTGNGGIGTYQLSNQQVAVVASEAMTIGAQTNAWIDNAGLNLSPYLLVLKFKKNIRIKYRMSSITNIPF
jgi:hypothetical protein